MTRQFARRAQTLSVVLLVAVVALAAAQAQTGSSPSSTTPSTPLAQDRGLPPQPWQRLLASRQAVAQGVSTLRSQTERSSFDGADASGAGFELPLTYGLTGVYPYSVAVADLNGDHKPDLVVANWFQNTNSNEGSVDVLLGNGDGTFKTAVSYLTGAGQALQVTIADVNGDHKPDLIVANSCLSFTSCTTGGGVSVLLGKGDGTFQPAVVYYTGGSLANWVAVADVNGDGHPDLVVDNYCYGLGSGCTGPGTVGVLMGNGDGTFQPALSDPTSGSSSNIALAVGDLNGDGHPDVVVLGSPVGNPNGGFLSVMLGNGDGTFQPQVVYDSGGYQPNSLAIADLNGDGHPDVVVAQYCLSLQDCGDGVATVLLDNSDGTLQSPVSYDVGGFDAISVAIGDVNGDGHPDLIVTDNGANGGNGIPGQVGVLLGKGDGTFQAGVNFPTGGSDPISVAASDVNGDGKPDLAVVNLQSTSVDVLLNNSGAAATTTAVTCSPNPSTYGQSVTVTATVSSSGGVPNGSIIFYDSSTILGTETLAGGTATITLSSLVAGSHSILAVFQGSSGFAPSSSSPVTQTVIAASTSTSITSSVNPVGVGQSVTYTATVAGQYGGAATGTVAFNDRARTVATVGLSGGQATYTTTYAAEGKHLIAATYSGDANDNGSVSPVLTEKVGNGASYSTATHLVTSGSPTFVGQAVTFTATITSAHGTIPDGETVTFYDGNKSDQTEIGTGTTAGGVATFTTSALAAGGHPITAAYIGDTMFKSSSGKVKQVVNKYTTTITLSGDPNPACAHDEITFTAVITSNGGPTPTGQVFFTDRVGYITLVDGVARAVHQAGSPGHFGITAKYEGDAFNGKVSYFGYREQVIYCGGGAAR